MANKSYHVYSMKGPGTTPNSRVINMRQRALEKCALEKFATMRVIDASRPYHHCLLANLRRPCSIRPSFAQLLAGSGALVFEGELLDI